MTDAHFRASHPKIALLLAAVSSLMELGPIAWLLIASESFTAIIFAGLAYQIGNVASRLQRALPWPYIFLLSILGALALAFFPIASGIWFLGLATLSWALQVVRRHFKTEEGADLPSTAQKRTARVAGFVAATLLPCLISLTVVVLAIGIALTLSPNKITPRPKRRLGLRHPLEWLMLVHQVHYFAYAYAIPYLLSGPALGNVPMVGIWFACGWISYLSAEALWRRFSPPLVFILGHLLLAFILCLLAGTGDRPLAVVVLWVMSGFGGGTVYCLTLLHHQQGVAPERMERAEDLGHMLGVATALAAVTLLNWQASDLPLIGSVCAGIAALIMIILMASRSVATKFGAYR
ncbi:hypothetical protein ACU8MB_00990 [Rhizobium leguminosarum]